MFRKAVLSGERGTEKWVWAGLKVFSWVCPGYFFLLGGKWPVILLAPSLAGLGSFINKWRGARRARANVCWGWGGVTGNVSGQESPGLLSSLNCDQKPFQENKSVCGTSSRGKCREQDSTNSSASFRSWVIWPAVSRVFLRSLLRVKVLPDFPSSCLWLWKSPKAL